MLPTVQDQHHHHHHHQVAGLAQMVDAHLEVAHTLQRTFACHHALLATLSVTHALLQAKISVVKTAQEEVKIALGHGHQMIQQNGHPMMLIADAMSVEVHHHQTGPTETLVQPRIQDSVAQIAMHATGHGHQTIQRNGPQRMLTADAIQTDQKLSFNEHFDYVILIINSIQ